MADLSSMKRVLIIGAGGAGKTTLARRLAAHLQLPLIHLDEHHWRAGWNPMPPDEWRVRVRELIAADAWIMDGNYGGTLDLRLAACDTVLFLDFPRHVCLWRVLRRRMWRSSRARAELPPGCPERVTLSFLVWVWTYPTRRREGIMRRLTVLGQEKCIRVLRSAHEVEQFMNEISMTSTP